MSSTAPLHILIVAPMRPDLTFFGCRRVLLEMGHCVDVLDLGNVFFPMERSLFWRVVHKVSISPLVHRVNRAVQQFLKAGRFHKPDLILTSSAEFLSPETLEQLKKQTGAPLFTWETDDYFSASSSSAYAVKSIPSYDCIFAHTRANVSELKRRGARQAEHLPFGADPVLYHQIDKTPVEPCESDAIFIGNWRPERARMLEHLVSRGISYHLQIWGHQWRHLSRTSPLRPYVHFAQVPWESYGGFFRKSKISLVFLVHYDTGLVSAPLRLFEIPAAGGFMLVERGRGEAGEFYKEGEEMACFSDADDLSDKINYFLQHDEERRRIALGGQRRAVRCGYFYTNNMERILQVYQALRENR